MVSFADSEHPIGIQLFGDSPEALGDAAKNAEDLGFDSIDINLGCPAHKVVKTGSGSALLKDKRSIANIVRTAKSSVKIPISAKIRSGWKDGDRSFLDIIPALEDEGIDLIFFHPRSREGSFKGSADWSLIREAVDISHVPIVGNGDILSGADAKKMVDETGCAAVMIGRGSLGNPWIFDNAARALDGGNLPQELSFESRISTLIEFVSGLVEHYGERRGMLNARKFIIWFTSGMHGAKAVRAKIHEVKCFDDFLKIAGMLEENQTTKIEMV